MGKFCARDFSMNKWMI